MARSKKTEETHFFANDGTDWKTQPSPVDLEEKIKADKALDEKATAVPFGAMIRLGRPSRRLGT